MNTHKYLLISTILFLGIFGLAESSLAADNTWTTITPTYVIDYAQVPNKQPNYFLSESWNKFVSLPNGKMLWRDGYYDDNTYFMSIYGNVLWVFNSVDNTITMENVSHWINTGGSDAWVPTDNTTPGPRHMYAQAAYVPNKNAVYFWGGACERYSSCGNTMWRYNLGTETWARYDNVAGYTTFQGQEAAMVYDSHNNVLVAHGENVGSYGSTGVWSIANDNGWEKYSSSPNPGSNQAWGPSLVYDPVRFRVLLFGGGPYGGTSNYLWSFDAGLKIWTRLYPLTSPPARQHAGFVYDSRRDIFVLYGGTGVGTYLNDTWIYHPNNNTWEQVAIANSVPTTTGGSVQSKFAYDNNTDTYYALVPNGSYTGELRKFNFPAVTYPAGTIIYSDVDSEKAYYTSAGWSWSSSAEPHIFSSSINVIAAEPGIHSDTEADDLWTNLAQYQRTKQKGYLDRANAWAAYFMDNTASGYYENMKNDLGAQCNNCKDHLYGWGLVDYYLLTGNAVALNMAKQIMEYSRADWMALSNSYMAYSVRAAGRNLHLASRLAEVTGETKWINLRDHLVDMLLSGTSGWNSTYKLYCGSGIGPEGVCGVSPMEYGQLVEGMYEAYRTTDNTVRRAAIKARLSDMASTVKIYGMDSAYNNVSYKWGIYTNSGAVWRYELPGTPVNVCGAAGDIIWDPIYNFSLVNLMVRGYEFTGDNSYLDKAKQMYSRGMNRQSWNSALCRTAADNVVSHFVDTTFDNPDHYFADNKGALQYTYALFGYPGVYMGGDTTPPAAPSGLRVN